ncbi:hypothetical protein ACHAXT_010110 [Thalassiosira profunda]
MMRRFFLLLALAWTVHPAASTREQLINGINRLNSDVLELRDVLESSISNRCNSIRGCYRMSFDECQSEYTERQVCPTLAESGYAVPDCGRGINCNGLFDYTITTVRMPASIANGKNGNPTNPEVTESVCYTRTAQQWMIRKYNADKDVWKALNVSSPQMYFGSSTGVFRIFPGRHSKECGVYDPRTRPWYKLTVPSTISNSVKPRNVVILMDTSRSMNETLIRTTNGTETKLSYMKKAVRSTVRGLSERASVAVIRFGEFPSIVGRPGAEEPFFWKQATEEHRDDLVESINKINVQGRSNWVSAFNFAFSLIRNSLAHTKAKDEYACELENIALLFFSDGGYNLPAGTSDDDVVELVSARVKEVEAAGDYHIHPFFYSLGNMDPDQVEKQISCAVDGYWTPTTGSIAPGNLTSGYSTLFSTPMGTDAFRNYTSWSEPYNFTTSGEIGYTVSSLVYNRDVEPARFMGAVGMDISAKAAQELYGGSMNETIIAMEQIIQASEERNFNATCNQQRINLTYCETQSMRHMTGGNAAICLPEKPETNISKDEVEDILPPADSIIVEEALNVTGTNGTNATSTVPDQVEDFVFDGEEIERPTEGEVDELIFDALLNCSKGFLPNCPGYDEYPDDLWRNVDLQGLDYQDRVCCRVGTNEVASECPKLDEIRNTKISDAAIFGILFGALVALELAGCYWCFYRKKRQSQAVDD